MPDSNDMPDSLKGFMLGTMLSHLEERNAQHDPNSMERNLPIVEIERISSRPWASATFEGLQHDIVISVRGSEDDVDALGDAMENDLTEADLDFGDGVLIDMVRTETDKTVDGNGHAVSLLTFVALSVLD